MAIAVALLMVSAGCLGGGESSTTPTEGSGVGGSEEVGSDVDDGDGTEDADNLALADPEAALRDAGSFTATWQYGGTDTDGKRNEVGFTYYADLNDGRTHTISTTGGDAQAGGWETYSTDKVTYARISSGESEIYQVVEQERDVVSEAVSYGLVYGNRANDGLHYKGTETFDGVTVKRYEITETDSRLWAAGVAAGGDQSTGGITVTEFRYIVLIDGDGLARHESWSYTGETSDGNTVTAEWEYTLTKIGSTVVEDPDWLSEAEAQAPATG